MNILENQFTHSLNSESDDWLIFEFKQITIGRTMRNVFNFITLSTVTFLISCASSNSVFRNRSIVPENFSTDAFLRTENGNHGSKITRIGIDANEKFLVSAGEDKTIRVWDIEGGMGKNAGLTQYRVIRPPIAGGKEGKLNAVAISPDANIIAASGWTGKWQTGKPKIYIFETQTGKMIQILEIEEQVYHLAFSDNGEYLVATVEESKAGIGFILYRIENNGIRRIGKGSDFEGDSYWATFYRRNGKQYLAATCFDGKIRIYSLSENELRGERILSAKNGIEAYSLSVSSDGEELAVGYRDTPSVDVYSLQSYQYIFSPSSSGIPNGSHINKVAYSGNKLFAGGEYENSQGEILLRIWQDKGRGAHNDIPVSNQTIMHLLPGYQGNIWLAAADPFIGKIQNDRVSLRVAPQKANFAEQQESFAVSEDGKEISFSYSPKENTKYYFSLTRKKIDQTVNSSGLKNPSWGGIPKEKWFGLTEPYIFRKLNLQEGEISRSLAFNPDTSYYALGTEWNIYYNDKLTGISKWKISTPSIVWAVNISGDGKFVVAALGDGTIRWYRVENGEELLAYFPHPDKKRWAVWTPQGFYDCSIDGEEFVGWHVNNAKDKEADFFPIARFRDTYFRPDILSKVLGKESVAVAVKEADKESGERDKSYEGIDKTLPGVIKIIPRQNITTNSEIVTIQFELTSPSKEKIETIRVWKNGSFDQNQKVNFSPSSSEPIYKGSIDIGVKDYITEIALSAITKGNEIGEKEMLRVIKTNAQNKDSFKPNLRILSIGVANYEDKEKKLKYSTDDAKDFFNIMKNQKGDVYANISYEKLLVDAKKKDILKEIEEISSESNSSDITVVFLSGHGVTKRGSIYYFLPVDYDPKDQINTGISGSTILENLANIRGNVLLFLDTCYSGTLTTDSGLKGLIHSSKDSYFTVFASSRDVEKSKEGDAWKNGVFTKALKDGIGCGKAKDRNNEITLSSLHDFISSEVQKLTDNQQTPVVLEQTVGRLVIAKSQTKGNDCK